MNRYDFITYPCSHPDCCGECSTARFTPGPWFVSEMHKDEVHCSEGDDFELVCETGGNVDNARLIAAAPEMYEALRQAAEVVRWAANEWRATEGDVGWADQVAEQIRAALAKANGEA